MAQIKPLEVEYIVKDSQNKNNNTPPNKPFKPNLKSKTNKFFSLKNFFKFISIISLVLLISVILVSIKVFSDYRSVPNVKEKITKSLESGASIIVDRNGEVIKDYKIDAKKEKLALKDIPEMLQHALIVREQERFYKDPNGIPWYNLGGAVFSCAKNVVSRNGESCRGGSGLFQQIVKNETGKNDSTLSRKYNELLQSIKASEDLSKEDILEIYFNNITFGRNSVGVQAGSKQFYGIGVNEAGDKTLKPHQACMLASMPNLPDHYSTAIGNQLLTPIVTSPIETKNWSYLKKVIDDCLDKLSSVEVIEGKKPIITKEQAQTAKQIPFGEYGFIERGTYGSEDKYKFLIEYIEDDLIKKFPDIASDQQSLRSALNTGNLYIRTTFDLAKQEQMQKALNQTINKISYGGVNMFGSVALDTSTSEVIAMLGNFDEKKPNTIIGPSSYFHPGSSSKPYYYASAFNNGFNPGTVMPDIKYKDPQLTNLRTNAIVSRNDGPVSIRYALQSSLNTVAEESLYLSQNTESGYAGSEGVTNAVAFAKRIGLKFPSYEDNCLKTNVVAIGNCNVNTLSHANAMATILNNGKYNEARPILEIKKNNSLYYTKADIDKLYSSVQQMDAGVARQTAGVISDYTTRRNGILINSAANFELPGWYGENAVAAKSGTAQVELNGINRVGDISAIGGSPYFTVLAWTGKVNADGGSTAHGLTESGSTIVPIWQKMMINLHEDKTPKGFSKESLISTKLDSKTGLLSSESSAGVKEELLTQTQINKLNNVKGINPSDKDSIFKTRTVLTSSTSKNEFDESVICYIPHSLFPDRAEFNEQKNILSGYISGCQTKTAQGEDSITTNINENSLFSKNSISIQATAKESTTPDKTNKINAISIIIRSIATGKDLTSSAAEGETTLSYPVSNIEDGKYNIYVTVTNSLGSKTNKVYKNIEFKKATNPVPTPTPPNTPTTPVIPVIPGTPSTPNNGQSTPNNNIPVPTDPTLPTAPKPPITFKPLLKTPKI